MLYTLEINLGLCLVFHSFKELLLVLTAPHLSKPEQEPSTVFLR